MILELVSVVIIVLLLVIIFRRSPARDTVVVQAVPIPQAQLPQVSAQQQAPTIIEVTRDRDSQYFPDWRYNYPYAEIGCTMDWQCGMGQICLNGACRGGPPYPPRPPHPPHLGCMVNSDCRGGQVCSHNMCISGMPGMSNIGSHI